MSSESTLVSVDKLISVIYLSSAAYLFGDAEILSILQQSRANNERDGLTGMLLYRDGNFLQVLEGPESVVRSTLRRIEKDPRHHGLLVVKTTTIEQRDFAEWRMGFRDVTADAFKSVEGYTPFMELSFASDEFLAQPSFAYRMLLQFKEKIR